MFFIFADLLVLPLPDIYRKILRTEKGRILARHVLGSYGGRRPERRGDVLRSRSGA